jgi:hypothetical protein
MYDYSHQILLDLLWLASIITTVFVLWKGDAAARYAALTHAAVEIATFIIHPRLGDFGAESLLLTVDLASSVVLLLLAVRYASLWLGGAMLLQSAQFSLHAYYLVMEMPQDRMHAWINNSCDWGILICLIVGTVSAIRGRVAFAREEAEREALRLKRPIVA